MSLILLDSEGELFDATVINDVVAVVDSILITKFSNYSILLTDTVSVTDSVDATGGGPTPPVPVVPGFTLPRDPNFLEKGLLRMTVNHPPSAAIAAAKISSLYVQFASGMLPTPLLIGRAPIMTSALLPAFLGVGPASRIVSSIVQGFSQFWLGVTVAGGTVTSFVGGPSLSAGLNVIYQNKVGTYAQTCRQLAKCLTLATHQVLYTIPGFPPLPLL